MKRYKFLRTESKSEHGNHVWETGKWYKYDGSLKLCSAGFHCSKGIYQAFSYVQGEILAEVGVKGEYLSDATKEVWEQMCVTKIYAWKKIDSVLFSIYAAELCLKNFEDVFPSDKRPREAIEAARAYALKPTKKNQLAARSAWSAARSAWSAAWSAATAAAESAAKAAAESAATAAAESAWLAAWSAWSAATAAAESAATAAAESVIYKKLDKWMLNHLEELKVLKEAK